jgi:hypothetical protein
MEIRIRADKDEILGGPDHIPYLKLELSEDGTAIVHAGHRHFDHYRVPMEEWSGRKRIWSASLSPGSYAIADPVMIQSLADRLKPLLKRVAAGHSIQWGGPNPIGRLTDDASEASVEIERLFQAERWWDGQREVWDADDWLYELGYDGAAKDYGLSIDSDDAAYKAAGERMKADACQHGVILVNVDALLHRIRRALQADAKVAALALECHLGESCR